MEPVTLVATALVAGAATGVAAAASAAVTDAYELLKSLVIGCFRRGGVAEQDGQKVIERAGEGASAREALERTLGGVTIDVPTVEAAQKLLELLDSQRSKFEVHAPDAKGLQVGDHNTQHNTFN